MVSICTNKIYSNCFSSKLTDFIANIAETKMSTFEKFNYSGTSTILHSILSIVWTLLLNIHDWYVTAQCNSFCATATWKKTTLSMTCTKWIRPIQYNDSILCNTMLSATWEFYSNAFVLCFFITTTIINAERTQCNLVSFSYKKF